LRYSGRFLNTVLEEPRAELTAVGSVEEALKALVSDIGLPGEDAR